MNNKEYKQIIITFFERDHNLGVATLANSLKRSGFKGLLRVGYRGHLPKWISQLKHVTGNEFMIADGFSISFVLLNTDMHFGYYKPYFLRDTINEYNLVEKICYFDPDIVVITKWDYISSWMEAGVALCLDNCFPVVPSNHPWREEWKKFANVSPALESNISHYVNSGFIGLNVLDVSILDRWILLTDKYRAVGGNLTIFEKDGYRAFKGDQDLLNAVITTSADIKFSIIGIEGMGFNYPAYLMVHAAEIIKPWEANFIKQLFLQGIKPSIGAKYYFQYCDYPIVVYPKIKLAFKKMSIKFASVIGGILGRN